MRLAQFKARALVQHVRMLSGDRQRAMRWTIYLITILISGCQGLSGLEWPTENALVPIMSLWERYQQCMESTNPEELVMAIEQFERATLTGSEPPAWMRPLGHHVMNQPPRVAVDPKALGAGCTLRAAELLVKAERMAEAQVLYRQVLMRYSNPDWIYYVDRAKEALVKISGSLPTVLAFRTDRAVPH